MLKKFLLILITLSFLFLFWQYVQDFYFLHPEPQSTKSTCNDNGFCWVYKVGCDRLVPFWVGMLNVVSLVFLFLFSFVILIEYYKHRKENERVKRIVKRGSGVLLAGFYLYFLLHGIAVYFFRLHGGILCNI